MENCEEKIERLEEENEKLKEQNIDLLFELNNYKFNELLEFVRNLNESIDMELEDKFSKLSKEDILKNLKNHIHDFAEYTKLNI